MSWMDAAHHAKHEQEAAAREQFDALAKRLSDGEAEDAESIVRTAKAAGRSLADLRRLVESLQRRATIQKGREDLAGAVSQLEAVSSRLEDLKTRHDALSDDVARTLHELEIERSQARTVLRRVELLLAADAD